MAPFQFQAPPDSHTGTIADLLEHQGQVQAQAAIASGNAWAHAGENIGSALGAIPTQMQDQQRRQQERELGGLEITQAKRANENAAVVAHTKQAMAGLMNDPSVMNEDGTFNLKGIADKLSSMPNGASGPVQQIDLKTLSDTIDPINASIVDAKANGLKFQQTKANALAGLAAGALRLGKIDGNYFSHASSALASAQKSGLLTDQESTQTLTQLVEHRENIPQILEDFVSKSTLPPVKLTPGEALANPLTGDISTQVPNRPQRPVNTPAGTYAPGDPNVGPNGILPGTAPPPKAPEKLDDWQSYLAAYARDKKQPVETLSAAQIADAKKTWTAAGEKASTDPSQAIAAAAAMTPRDASAPLHDEVLKGLAPAAANQVKALATGRMQFPAGAALREPYWQNMIGLVAAYDPSFDTGNYNARATARKDFTSGASAKQITSLNTVIGHIGDLADKSQALSNSSLPAYNAAKNWLKTATGSSDITNFDTVKKGVVDELTRVWRQSGGTEQDIKTWSASLNASESPDQLKGALSTIGGMLESRLSALENQRQQALGNGGDDLKVLTPASRAILDRLQGKTSGAPAAAAPRSAPADGQAGLVNGRPAVWKTNGAQGPGWYASDSGSK